VPVDAEQGNSFARVPQAPTWRVNPLVFRWIWRKCWYSWVNNRADEVILFGHVTYDGHRWGE